MELIIMVQVNKEAVMLFVVPELISSICSGFLSFIGQIIALCSRYGCKLQGILAVKIFIHILFFNVVER